MELSLWDGAVVLLGIALAYRGVKKGSLSVSGGVAAVAIVTGWCGGIRAVTALISFYYSSSKLTKLKEDRKRKLEDDFKPGGQRDHVQVFCNALMGCIASGILCFYVDRNTVDGFAIDFDTAGSAVPSLCVLATLAHYCCCAGDTWSSELGILNKDPPILITTMAPVPAGTNGGISLMGTAAAVGGGAFVSLFVAIVSFFTSGTMQYSLIIFGTFCGLVGSLCDSVLGATLQYSGFDESKGKIVAKPGPSVKHVSGTAILDNHLVNLVTSIIVSVVMPLVFMLIAT